MKYCNLTILMFLNYNLYKHLNISEFKTFFQSFPRLSTFPSCRGSVLFWPIARLPDRRNSASRSSPATKTWRHTGSRRGEVCRLTFRGTTRTIGTASPEPSKIWRVGSSQISTKVSSSKIDFRLRWWAINECFLNGFLNKTYFVLINFCVNFSFRYLC